MKSSFTILFVFNSLFLLGQFCTSYGDAQIDLNVNNINARLLNSGDFWWDGADARYITSDDGMPEVSAIFAGALWIGGLDPNYNLKLAGQSYRNNGATDWYPGPIDPDGHAFENGCTDWDRFWVINKQEIENHNNDFNDGTIQNQIPNIYGWPGRNNPHFESLSGFPLPVDQDLAPFWDEDFDGNYDPDKGDYPLIKGDQSIWWVFNDIAGFHNVTPGAAMQMEVQAMAYAYKSESNEDLNNTTFYDFKMINKATDYLQKSFIGLWVDFDLGCHTDDYVGYDEEYQMMFAYNEDDIDGDGPQGDCQGGINTYGNKTPMIGIKKLDGSFNPVTSFMTIQSGSGNPSTTDPQLDIEYYNYLTGKWRDGTPLTSGGNGFNPTSTDTISFSFNGDPSDENAWSMCTSGLPFADYRSVMSTAMPLLQPGQSTTASYAVIFVEDIPHPCPSLDRLRAAADNICEIASITNVSDINPFDVKVSPNPTIDNINIESDSHLKSIKLLNMSGQILISLNEINNDKVELDVISINPGLYLLLIENKKGYKAIEKIIINK